MKKTKEQLNQQEYNAHFCCGEDLFTNNESEKKQHFLQHKEKHKIPKKLTQMGRKA